MHSQPQDSAQAALFIRWQKAPFISLSFLSHLKDKTPSATTTWSNPRPIKEYLLRLTKHVDFRLRQCLKFAVFTNGAHALDTTSSRLSNSFTA